MFPPRFLSLQLCLSAIFGGALLPACSSLLPSNEPVNLEGMAYNSITWRVRLAVLPAGTDAAALQQVLQGSLDQVNGVLSTYQADSELMRFNRSALGEWVPVSPILFDAVKTAQQVCALSGGAYDITVAPLVDLWGFGPRARPAHMPTAAAIAAARARVGCAHLHMDEQRQALRRDADISLDLSSVGEGVGVDQLSARLERLGVRDYMVAVAGTLRAHGHRPGGGPWQIAIEKPDASGEPQRLLAVSNQVVSSSGSYRNGYELDGVYYSHAMDPATGYPISHHGVSVTVALPDNVSATRADALATAFNVLGPERGYALAQREHIPVFYIEREGTALHEKYTRDFSPLLAR